jgi:hypothetical protein
MFPNRVIKLAKNVEEFVEIRRDVTSVSNSDVHVHFTVLPAQQASRLEQQSLRKKKRKVLHNYRMESSQHMTEAVQKGLDVHCYRSKRKQDIYMFGVSRSVGEWIITSEGDLERKGGGRKVKKIKYGQPVPRVPPTRTLPEYGFADNYTSLKLAQAGNKLWIPADARESILGEAVFNESLANGSCKETFQVHFVDCETVPGSSVGWHTSCQ